jgi:hypothetical protein
VLIFLYIAISMASLLVYLTIAGAIAHPVAMASAGTSIYGTPRKVDSEDYMIGWLVGIFWPFTLPVILCLAIAKCGPAKWGKWISGFPQRHENRRRDKKIQELESELGIKGCE